MIVLITGASHTGKTVLAQKLLEKYHFPYLSVDHLKMGLVRSGETKLTPEDDKELTPYLWNILKEIIKTAIENEQNLIIEGLYIPFNWKESFSKELLEHIDYYCLIMTQKYIEKHFTDIKQYANSIDKRVDDSDLTIESMIENNTRNLEMCKKYECDYILIDETYKIDLKLEK
ncbi:AAA family ATPase [Candidatus Enterococcus murrayae]|uniref:AAA family ATPase n=1 Tax=Candidatus Enterococcus murrayae TaxID=2815321 RepID=A0ABS3HIY7_9ENTE|nr:AAA family ATPase [Enterococcus sp. MJM16]MBO0453410.1 AAA family ATPase [Enterococcus sp. MJM16]